MSSTATRPPNRGGNVYGTRRKTGPRWGRIILVLVGILAIIGLVIAGCGIAYYSSLDNKLKRTDAFAGIDGDRPNKTVSGALNILILGSDSRDGAAFNPKDRSSTTATVAGERSDAIMVLHIPANHDRAYIVSIPRDTYVFVPKYKGQGGRKAKINAAFAWGGIPLTVATVENFTGVKMDHVLKVDFNGFQKMTDAVGGVDVTVAKTVTDPRSKWTFKAGVNHLNGAAALDYVRQRYGLPGGDFDRVARQQIFLRALLKKATDTGTLSNPVKLKNFLDAATSSLTVDNGFSLTDTALQFRNLRPGDLTFITNPNNGSQTVNGESVVVSNKPKAAALWDAVNNDKVTEWMKSNQANNATAGR